MSASTEQHWTSEKLVRVHQARDEWEGTLLLGYLRDNGLEATIQGPPALPPFDTADQLSGNSTTWGLYVLEHEAVRAQALIEEFLASATDESVLEETAAQSLHVDRAAIARLRGQIEEERATFDLLGWLGVIFLVATGVLWAIWPSWLKVGAPPLPLRGIGLLLLVLAAVFIGSWSGRRLH